MKKVTGVAYGCVDFDKVVHGKRGLSEGYVDILLRNGYKQVRDPGFSQGMGTAYYIKNLTKQGQVIAGGTRFRIYNCGIVGLSSTVKITGDVKDWLSVSQNYSLYSIINFTSTDKISFDLPAYTYTDLWISHKPPINASIGNYTAWLVFDGTPKNPADGVGGITSSVRIQISIT